MNAQAMPFFHFHLHIPPTTISRVNTTIRRLYEERGDSMARGVFAPAAVAELERNFDRIVANATQSGVQP